MQAAVSAVVVAAPFVGLCRVDVVGHRLILLGIPFTPQEFGPVFGLMLLGMFVVFAGALIHGRLWCGWLCPQTTLSELVETLERWLRRGRRRSTARRAAAVFTTLVVSALVGASAISYFLPPDRYLSPPPVAWIAWALTTAVLAVNLLWVRHRFCVGLCPYGILQSIVMDDRTLRVTPNDDRIHECFDCKACVRSCFMGVDPRQAGKGDACIACGECIDMACVMCGDCVDAGAEVHGADTRMLRFEFDRSGSTWPAWLVKAGISDVKRASLVIGVGLMSVALALMLFGRADLDLRLSPRHDQLAAVHGGRVINHYTLTVGSRLDHEAVMELEASGLDGLVVESAGPVAIGARERTSFDLSITVPAGGVDEGAHPIVLTGRVDDLQFEGEMETRFFVPRGDS